jgi:hypothetical protein
MMFGHVSKSRSVELLKPCNKVQKTFEIRLFVIYLNFLSQDFQIPGGNKNRQSRYCYRVTL